MRARARARNKIGWGGAGLRRGGVRGLVGWRWGGWLDEGLGEGHNMEWVGLFGKREKI